MNAQVISKSKSLIVLIAFCLPFIATAQVVEIQCVLTEGTKANAQLLAFNLDTENKTLILWGTEATDSTFAPKYGKISKLFDQPLPYVEDDQKSMLKAMGEVPGKRPERFTFTFDRVGSIIRVDNIAHLHGVNQGSYRGKCKVIDKSNKF